MTVTVLAPFESADRMLCVDVFRRGDGSFGFEEFRSERDGSSRTGSGAGSLGTNDIVRTIMLRSRHGSSATASLVLAAMLIPPAARAAESDDAARYTLKREQRFVLLSRFKPARCKGVPCAMAFPVHIAFKVE